MENTNQFTPTESKYVNGQVIESRNSSNMPEFSTTKPAHIEFYTLNQYELDIISKGADSPLHLTFFFFSFPISFGALITLMFASISSLSTLKLQLTLTIIVVFGVISIWALLKWYFSKNELKELIKIIKSREKIVS
ncbi:hypothetical protein [Flectobacillus roseus]|uniref:Uncharacterized protein n=1 Tax=Flectobacillus roseus TaxID=502259 RepID=A0ABT6YG99_9BACT|nr:hypothetical protein [Flectobacillus roseus]MDI9862590.1 hypothetical protein [Flectobacillus roseus]